MNWFKTKIQNGKMMVFDPIRKIYCTLTPEERVRQKILYFLIEKKNYPAGLIAIEYSIKVNNLPKRCDIAIFDQLGQPLMIIECKAESVQLTENVLDQAIRYYSGLQVPYILLTNSKTTYCYHIDMEKNTITCLQEIPELF